MLLSAQLLDTPRNRLSRLERTSIKTTHNNIITIRIKPLSNNMLTTPMKLLITQINNLRRVAREIGASGLNIILVLQPNKS